MENKQIVCAVVVTYNRKDLLIECLEALENQIKKVDTIIIVDNASDDKTEELLKEKSYIDTLPPQNINEPYILKCIKNSINIKYIKMDENTGGAGGFHMGTKTAYEDGYDWIWLMDDDVEAKKNALEELLKYQNFSKCIHPSRSILNDETFNWDGYLDVETMHRVNLANANTEHKEFTFVNVACFEGMLIHKDIIKQIGYPDKRFFIGYDDTIYGLKASRYTNILLTKKILMNKKIDKEGYSEFSAYYFIRNLFLLKNILDEDYPLQRKKRKFFFKVELFYLYYKTYKSLGLLKTIKLIKKALKDAKNNKFYK